jgi:2-iminobutanoate/2-iminopropanoate deaminase
MTRTTTTIRARSALVIAGLAALIVGILVGAAFQQSAVAQQSKSGRKAIHPEKSPNTGLPYSPGILAGNTLYVSGNLGRDPVSAKLVPGGIEAETRQSLANIRETLKAAGMDFKDVVSVTAYIANFNDFEKFNAVYREYFPTDPPARTTVQVAALNIGAKIELQMIAVKP